MISYDEYSNKMLFSCFFTVGFQWNMHTHLQLLALERGFNSVSAVKQFWQSAPVVEASFYACVYACLTNDLFSVLGDIKVRSVSFVRLTHDSNTSRTVNYVVASSDNTKTSVLHTTTPNEYSRRHNLARMLLYLDGNVEVLA